MKSSSRDSSFTQNPSVANSSNLIKPAKPRYDCFDQNPNPANSKSNPNPTNTPPPPIETHKPKTNNHTTTHPDWNPKPKPNKYYSYPWRRRGDPYPPILISVVNQVCLSFSLILLFFFFFNSKSHSDASADENVIFELEKKKEEGRRKFFGFLKQELEIYKLDFPPRNRVFKTQFASKIKSNKLEMLVS